VLCGPAYGDVHLQVAYDDPAIEHVYDERHQLQLEGCAGAAGARYGQKRTWPATLMKYDEHITISAGTDAVTRSGMSVYMRAMASGNRQKRSTIALTIAYESFSMRLISDITLS